MCAHLLTKSEYSIGVGRFGLAGPEPVRLEALLQDRVPILALGAVEHLIRGLKALKSEESNVEGHIQARNAGRDQTSSIVESKGIVGVPDGALLCPNKDPPNSEQE